MRHASPCADSKGDPAGAAKVVDRVLGLRDERPTPAELFRLLVLRADVAGRPGDEATAVTMLGRAASVHLTAEDRESVRDDLERLGELRG